jgi:hypothetical protein
MTWTKQRLLLVSQLRAQGVSFAAIGERYGMAGGAMMRSYLGARKRAAKAAIPACQDSQPCATAETHTTDQAGIAA